MAAPYILEADHVTKVFGELKALSDVSLAVERGRIHVLLGEDGAGKTTLMRIVGGAHPAGTYSGEVRLDGRPIAFRSPGDAIRASVGVVLRRPGVFEQLSIAENVMLSSWQRTGHHLVNPRTTCDEAQALFDRWEIDLNPAAKARGLTSVQHRMVMIARALSIQPVVVLLDEPLYGIPDPQGASRVFHAVRRLAQAGIGCLYLARRLNEACQIGDTVTVLRDGTVAGTWSRTMFDEAAMAHAMLSQRAGDFKHYDDEEDRGSGGIFGSFQRWFTNKG